MNACIAIAIAAGLLANQVAIATTFDCSYLDTHLAHAYQQLRETKDPHWKNEAVRLAGLKADCVLGILDPERGLYVDPKTGVPKLNTTGRNAP